MLSLSSKVDLIHCTLIKPETSSLIKLQQNKATSLLEDSAHTEVERPLAWVGCLHILGSFALTTLRDSQEPAVSLLKCTRLWHRVHLQHRTDHGINQLDQSLEAAGRFIYSDEKSLPEKQGKQTPLPRAPWAHSLQALSVLG